MCAAPMAVAARREDVAIDRSSARNRRCQDLAAPSGYQPEGRIETCRAGLHQ